MGGRRDAGYGRGLPAHSRMSSSTHFPSRPSNEAVLLRLSCTHQYTDLRRTLADSAREHSAHCSFPTWAGRADHQHPATPRATVRHAHNWGGGQRRRYSWIHQDMGPLVTMTSSPTPSCKKAHMRTIRLSKPCSVYSDSQTHGGSSELNNSQPCSD